MIGRNRLRLLLAVTIAAVSGLMLAMQALTSAGTFDARLQPDPGNTGDEPSTAETQALDADALAATNCRYGVGYVGEYWDSLAWIPTLDAGWYINFTTAPPGRDIRSATFAPVIRIEQEFDGQGNRLPTFKLHPPLAQYYVDENGFEQKGVGTLVSENLGHFWIVGNEPDVDNFTQDNTMPDVYARAYRQAYQYIKAIDPTARVGIAGLSMMTPGRMQYLDIVWDTYRDTYGTDMPVDIWNMHLYILEERNPSNPNQYGDGKIALGTDPALAKLTSYGDKQFCPAKGAADIPANDPYPNVYCRSEHDSVRIFKEQVYNMRNWMKAHGQQNKPLIISEYSLLYPYIDGQPNGTCEFLQDEHQQCFNPQRVTKFLNDTVAFMENTKDPNLGYPQDENRLVQQWLWFSIITRADWSGGPSNLIKDNYESYPLGDPGALTQMGVAFRQAATSNVGQSNLVAGQAYDVRSYANYPGNTGSANLLVSFRNSGTQSIIEPFKVTFYRDAALTQPIGSVTVSPENSGAITGCTWNGRNSEHVRLKWNNLPVGTHSYWAKIDSESAVGETSEADNVTAKGTVTISPIGLFVPVVHSSP